jgi:drug/metabolite transporter (DMT)-like permease
MIGILLGLAGAAFWGTADFLARGSTRIIGTYRTLFFMQMVGLLGLTIYLGVSGILTGITLSAEPGVWAAAVGVGLLNVISSLSLYRALEVGVLAIVSPIAAGYSAVTVVLSLVSGEALTLQHLLGIALTITGGILAATEFQTGSLPVTGFKRGVGWALLAACSYGVLFWLMGLQVTPTLGGIVPVWIIRVVTPLTLLVCALPLRQSLRPPTRRTWLTILIIGVMDTMGYVAVGTGLTSGQVSIVTVLSALFGVVTVLLAWLFLREPLQRSQWVGVCLLFVGIALVSL